MPKRKLKDRKPTEPDFKGTILFKPNSYTNTATSFGLESTSVKMIKDESKKIEFSIYGWDFHLTNKDIKAWYENRVYDAQKSYSERIARANLTEKESHDSLTQYKYDLDKIAWGSERFNNTLELINGVQISRIADKYKKRVKIIKDDRGISCDKLCPSAIRYNGTMTLEVDPTTSTITPKMTFSDVGEGWFFDPVRDASFIFPKLALTVAAAYSMDKEDGTNLFDKYKRLADKYCSDRGLPKMVFTNEFLTAFYETTIDLPSSRRAKHPSRKWAFDPTGFVTPYENGNLDFEKAITAYDLRYDVSLPATERTEYISSQRRRFR
jgi:hypothetical protein